MAATESQIMKALRPTFEGRVLLKTVNEEGRKVRDKLCYSVTSARMTFSNSHVAWSDGDWKAQHHGVIYTWDAESEEWTPLDIITAGTSYLQLPWKLTKKQREVMYGA